MRYWYIFSIYRICMNFFTRFFFKVDNKLMAKQVKVYPELTTSAFFTAKNFSVELSTDRNNQKTGYKEDGKICSTNCYWNLRYTKP